MTLFETICVMTATFAAVYIYLTKNSNRKSVEDFPIRFSNDKNKVKSKNDSEGETILCCFSFPTTTFANASYFLNLYMLIKNPILFIKFKTLKCLLCKMSSHYSLKLAFSNIIYLKV